MIFKNIQNKINGKQKRAGFTLVEALVAVAIVLLGVTAAFTSAQFGLSSTSAVRNRVTAMYLAQEALEGVKNIKDSNLLKRSAGETTRDWLEGINPGTGDEPDDTPCSAFGASHPCGYDIGDGTTAGTLARCTSVPQHLQGCVVFTTGQTGTTFYRQMSTSGGTDTGFVRVIYVDEIVPDNEALVTVLITRPGTTFPPFQVQTLIYNWF